MRANRNDIITLPHKSLRQKSKKVNSVDDKIKTLIKDMTSVSLDWEDHRDHEVTVGLAAVQINRLERVIIIREDLEERSNKSFTALINPEITDKSGKPIYELEGCLSVSGYYGRIKRYPKVSLKALAIDGKPVRITAEGFLARLLQHEVDHINGKTYIDRLDQDGELYAMKDDGKLELISKEEYDKVLQSLKSTN